MTMINNEIEQVAATVINNYVHRGNGHTQLLNIMQAENIKFKEVTSVSDAFVGALTCGNNGQIYIVINSSIESLGRKVFTISHEIGHYFLKHQLQYASFYCSDNDIAEESYASDLLEREANHFASCFLMPEDKVRSAFLGILKRSKKTNSRVFLCVKNDYSYGIWCGIREDLMKRYGVSEAALRYRLKYLQLAEFDFAN